MFLAVRHDSLRGDLANALEFCKFLRGGVIQAHAAGTDAVAAGWGWFAGCGRWGGAGGKDVELLAVGKPLGMVERDCVCTGKGLSGVEGIGDARAGLEGLQAGLGHLANDRDDDFTVLCTGCSARITAYCRRLGHARGFIGAGVDAKPRHHADDENDR